MCVFCDIVAGDLPAHVVLDDAQTLAFLDAKPLFPGHTLLVPKQHLETLSDLAEAMLGPLFSIAQRLARAVETAVHADGSLVLINNRVSQSVPHLHVHVVPRRFRDGLRGFLWPRTPYADEASAEAVAASIRSALHQVP